MDGGNKTCSLEVDPSHNTYSNIYLFVRREYHGRAQPAQTFCHETRTTKPKLRNKGRCACVVVQVFRNSRDPYRFLCYICENACALFCSLAEKEARRRETQILESSRLVERRRRNLQQQGRSRSRLDLSQITYRVLHDARASILSTQ